MLAFQYIMAWYATTTEFFFFFCFSKNVYCKIPQTKTHPLNGYATLYEGMYVCGCVWISLVNKTNGYFSI